MTFIKDVMKNVLASSTMSSSDNFFASKSLTTECVLSSNEISYSLKSLIDIEAADYSFIDELITQNVCDHLQIESLSLIKLKSIREFCYDSSYASSLIAMLMTMLMIMLMTILRVIVDRLSLEHKLVSKSTLFRISLCSSESYK